MCAFRGYRMEHVNIDARYDSVGSGAGKRRIKGIDDNYVHYGASDVDLTQAEQEDYPNLVVIQTIAGWVDIDRIPGQCYNIITCEVPNLDGIFEQCCNKIYCAVYIT